MGVFRKPDRLEAALLARTGELVWTYRIICRKHRNAKFHTFLLLVRWAVPTLLLANGYRPAAFFPASSVRSMRVGPEIMIRKPCSIRFSTSPGPATAAQATLNSLQVL